MVLNWHENLPKDELPPKHIWADPEGLELWWAKVEERRSDGLKPPSGGSTESAATEGTGNDLAAALRQQ